MFISSIFFHMPNGSSTKLVEEDLSNLTKIGQGSFASVFRKSMATFPGISSGSKDIAIKATIVEEPYIRTRTEEEIRILKNLQGLPHIAVFIGSFDTQDYITMTTNFIQGGTLSDMIVKTPHYANSFTVLSITKQIASALEALRNKGIIHGDMASRNVMFDGSRVTIIDFGLSVDLTTASSKDHVMYAVNYRPPECFLGIPVTNNSPDVYALGVLVYYIYTKHYPINGTSDEAFDVYNNVMHLMEDLFNAPPVSLLAQGEFSKHYYFPASSVLKDATLTRGNYHHPRKLDLIMDIAEQHTFEAPARGLFLKNLIEKMLRWEPTQRITPQEIVQEIDGFEKNGI